MSFSQPSRAILALLLLFLLVSAMARAASTGSGGVSEGGIGEGGGAGEGLPIDHEGESGLDDGGGGVLCDPDFCGPLRLSGYAWGSGLGWISFANNGGYEDDDPVYLKAANGTAQYRYLGGQGSGDDDGYAWSPGIGWIRFDESLSGPTGASDAHGARLNLSTSKFSGWVRACAVFASGCSGALKPESETGGWDGWISMSGTGTDEDSGKPFTYTSAADSVAAPKRFSASSYAWAGSKIGYIRWCGPNTYPNGANAHCVRFGGLAVSLSAGNTSLSYDPDNPTSHQQEVGYTASISNPSVPNYRYKITWQKALPPTSVNSGPTAAVSYTPTARLYDCNAIGNGGEGSVTEKATLEVTDNNNDKAYFTLQPVITCTPITGGGGGTGGELTDPTPPVIRISSQPLAFPAISSATSFYNQDDDSGMTVSIQSSESTVDNAVSLTDHLPERPFADLVKCRMENSVLPTPLPPGDTSFGSCDSSHSLLLPVNGSANPAYFNIKVLSNPPVDLNKFSPYKIVIGGDVTVCTDPLDPLTCTTSNVSKSFLFDYAVGSIKPQ